MCIRRMSTQEAFKYLNMHIYAKYDKDNISFLFI